MKTKQTTTKQMGTTIERPPVVVVMGHIDHGKSTLLDYIRHTNTTDKEDGGITQHVAAYEVTHVSNDSNDVERARTITFLDTPGHAAFGAIRSRSTKTSDVAILVVAADDGVKEQTKEALKVIEEEKIPYIVAINKIDKPAADVAQTKNSLAESGIYVEGYGGSIAAVEISAKTGAGIPELLDMILLVSELENLTAETNLPAEGIVIESNLDSKKGISATLIINNGTLTQGMFVASGGSIAPVRIMEDSLGEKITEATFSTPIQIIGWNLLPVVGLPFASFTTKKEAEKYASEHASLKKLFVGTDAIDLDKTVVPIIVKADTIGSLEGIIGEIKKFPTERAVLKILVADVGPVAEKDIQLAAADKRSLVIGFHTPVDTNAKNLAEREAIEIHSFAIIYKLTEWLEKEFAERIPKIATDEVTGSAKILRVFSHKHDKQVIGCRVEEGTLSTGEAVKIIRRENEIGKGHIRELQKQKDKVSKVEEEDECGMMLESRIEVVPGDILQTFHVVKK